MPDVVGMNLQAAQNHLQAVTDYGVPLSTSTDGSGQGRMQVMDRNWVVCEQTPAAGAALTSGDVPDLVVVKDDESC
jgi:beta-lactam-binding protein with PASTA domain